MFHQSSAFTNPLFSKKMKEGDVTLSGESYSFFLYLRLTAIPHEKCNDKTDETLQSGKTRKENGISLDAIETRDMPRENRRAEGEEPR